MRLIGLLAAAALLLAGCGAADPVPKVPKQSASATPTATLPVMPAQANEASPEGAASFVSHYVDVFNFAAATGNTAPLLALSKDCEACTEYSKRFKTIYDRGDRIAGTLWKLKSRDLQILSDSIDVTTTIETVEKGQRTTYKIGFVLPLSPPYVVSEIYKGDNK